MSILRAEFGSGNAVLQALWQLQVNPNWRGEVIQNLTSIQLVQRMKQVWQLSEWELSWHHFCERLKLISAPYMKGWGTLLRSNDLETIKLVYDGTAGSPYLWTWGPKLPAPWSGSAAHLCISQPLNRLSGKPATTGRMHHHVRWNRHLTWKKVFLGPSPVISGQTHWEKLALSWFPWPYSRHKPFCEEWPEGLFHIHERTWRQFSILISKDANVAKREKRSNMGSGTYLHRGCREPSVVLENSLENSDVHPIPVSLQPGEEREIARGLQQLGVTGQQQGESLPQTRTWILSYVGKGKLIS